MTEKKITNGFPVGYDNYGIPYVDCEKCKHFDYDEFNHGNGDYREIEVCRKSHDLYPRRCFDYLDKKWGLM